MAIPAFPAAHASNIEARLLRQGETLHVPYIFDAEVLQAVRRRALRRELTGHRAGEALEDFAALDVMRYPHHAPVVTADAKLARAPGHHARVELYAR